MSSGSVASASPPKGGSDNGTGNSCSATAAPLTGPAVIVRLLSNDCGSNSGSKGRQPPSDNGWRCNERAVRLNEEWMVTPSCQGLVADIVSSSIDGPTALRDAVRSVTGRGGGDITPQSFPQQQKQKQKEVVTELTPVDRITASIRLVQLLASLFDVIVSGSSNSSSDPKRRSAPLASGESGANAAAAAAAAAAANGSISNGDGSANSSHSGDNCEVVTKLLTGGEMVKLSGEVMTSLAAFVTSLSRDNNDDNAATTATADDSSSVVLAQYAFESAYRSLHHLVKARAQFLASIWRGLCDVAVAAAAASTIASTDHRTASSSSAAAAVATQHRSRHRYVTSLSDAVATLTEYVSEGTRQLERVLSPILLLSSSSSSSSTRSSSSISTSTAAEPLSLSSLGSNAELAGQVRHLVKMFVFLLARVATIAPIWLSTSSSSSSSPSSAGVRGNSDDDGKKSVVLSDLMNATARLKGLSVRLEIVAEGARRRQEGQPAGGEAVDNAKRHVLDPIAKLGTKCDGLVQKTLISSGGAGRQQQQQQQDDVSVVHFDGLNALLGVADDSTRGETRSISDDGRSSLHRSLALGKLFLLRVVLHKFRSSSTATGDSKGLDNSWNIEASLSICEDVLFVSLPLCHSLLNPVDANDSFGPSALLDVVDLIADCTLRSELCCDSSLDESMPSRTDQTHMMLVRWLIPSNTECGRGGGMYLNLHPLSREMVICVIHLHILRLCALASVTGRGSVDPSSYVFVSASQLISLLCSILIDPRTAAEARENVAAVLTRLLGGSLKDVAVEFARNETVCSFVDAMNVLASRGLQGDIENFRKAGRKRPRKESKAMGSNLFYLARHWSAQELDAVGSVLLAASGHALFWKEINDDMKTNIQQVCEKVSVSVVGKRPGSIGLIIHLLHVGGGASQLQTLCIDVSKFHSKVIQLLSAVLKDKHSKVNNAVPSLLRFVQSYMKSRKQSYPCHELGILAASLQNVAQQSVSEGVFPVYIMHAIASLLSQVGSSISSDCPREVLKSISSTFFSLFQSNQWPLVAETMSSLEVFLTTMPKVHSAYIPQCLPSQFQTFISSRMQENIFDIEKMTTLTMEELRCRRLEEDSVLLYLSRARRRKLYTRTDLMIEINSTAVTLSKDGEVGAILIIPRGSSLSVDNILSDTSGLIPNKLGLISHAVSARDGSSSALQIEDKP